MPVCKYFLEGRCRFGNNCWNEHPRGGAHSNNRGNWGNQFQKHQPRYIQPSTFSKPPAWGSSGRDVERRGFGSSDTGKKAVSSSSSFIQNRFTALSNDNEDRDADSLLELVRKDIESWESSGQWLFSCYSVTREYACVSGLVDISPEELRLEYYNSRAGGSLQHYVESVRQLSNQHRNKMLELKKPNSSARASMIMELKKPNQQKAAVGFGGVQPSGFNSSAFTSATASSNTFSFKPDAGLGTATAAPSFGNSMASTAPPQSGFGTKAADSSSVFGNKPTFGAPSGTVASFSVFSSSVSSSAPGISVFGNSSQFGSNTTASSSFGSSASTGAPISSAFGSCVTSTTDAFGGLAATAATTTTTNTDFGTTPIPVSQPQNTPVNGCDALYTPQAQLSADDLQEFQAKTFTLGKIPLRPPPIELLTG
ncbi:nucleoporin NUP42 [Mobula birostris]|uniref:nucleoporin NUP42 n=1 Tax=Mobula birostris TaxID=1983395 RepID=UPI003B2875A8